MKILIYIFIFFFKINLLFGNNNAIFFVESALKSNPRYNSEKENLKAVKENKNISRSEFLPSVTLSGTLDSSQSTNRTNQSNESLADTNLDTETKKFEIEQKIFQGFQGYNSLKKSDLEISQATFQLKQIEQETILDTVIAYSDLLFKIKNNKFNTDNASLFERQVESDSARLQKGEITLTDLAQAESSLAKANANLISAETELLTAKTNFKRVIGIDAPKDINDINFDVILPNSLNEALEISLANNPELVISRLDFQISQKNLNIEKSKFSPSASINYSKSETDELSTSINKADKESVKATITWPIIKGGENISSIKKSSLKKQKSLLLSKDAESKLITETTNSWSKYQSSESVLKATEAQLKAAEIANEGITLEYDSGNTRTTLEVIQSRSLLLDARIDYAKAERDFVISKFELAFKLGSLSLESIKSF